MSGRVAYNIEQAAESTGVTAGAITIAIREKRLRAYRIENQARVLQEDLIDWVRSQPRF